MKKWIYPANPKLYNVVSAFKDEDETAWPMTSKVDIGDTVYIYCGQPYKQVLFQCEVVSTTVSEEVAMEQAKKYINGDMKEGPKKKAFMLLKTKKEFEAINDGPLSFSTLKLNGLKGSIMGPQCLDNNKELYSYITLITE